MKLLETFFKEAKEKVDEPEGGPLGKVVFGSKRLDNAEPEENTEFEEEFFRALWSHHSHNLDDDLSKITPKILSLIDSGKYQIMQAPKNQKVFRGLGDMPIENASRIIGVDSKELLSPKMSGKAKFYNTTFDLTSMNTDIQPWSLEPNVALTFATELYDETLDLDPGNASLLAISNTNNGNFFMNPDFQGKVRFLATSADEKEVISYGPVKLIGAIVVVNTKKKPIAGKVVRSRLEKAFK